MTDNNWVFFPGVKQAERRNGSFWINHRGLVIRSPKLATPVANRMAERFQSLYNVPILLIEDDCPYIAVTQLELNLQESIMDVDVQSLELPQHLEGYTCTVTNDCMRIQAHTYRGFLYGWFTLEQWIHEAVKIKESPKMFIPNMRLADWPDLDLRGHHLDFKGSVPLMSYVKETIERLAHLRINTLLIEYEDQFPYQSLPHIHHPNGFTQQDISEMLAMADKCGMEVIPFIQSLGHVDFVLKHQTYRHLCEDGLTFQYCPCHPGSLQVFKDMVDEIITLHPNSRFIHIGADEAVALGRCETCQSWMREGGDTRTKVDLFLHYVKEAAEYVLRQGKQPIMWDDMFHSEKCVDRISELPEGTALCSWSYYDMGKSNWVWWSGKYYSSKQWLVKDPGFIPQYQWLEDLPESEQAAIRSVWDKGEYPLYGSNNIPWIQAYKEQIPIIFGASCVRGADHTNQWCAKQEDRIQNVIFWAKFAKESSLSGVISSAWTRFYSLSPSIEPWETEWYPLSAHACYSWHTATMREEFDQLWTHTFAAGDPILLKAIQLMEKGGNLHKAQYYYAARQLLTDCQFPHAWLHRYAEMLRSSAHFAELTLRFETALRDVEWVMYVKEKQPLDNDVILERGFKVLTGLLGEADHWEKYTSRICLEWMSAPEVEELVMSKLHSFKVRADIVHQHSHYPLQ
ncbi:family 20 glycosylhydrolase [Paenibacillus oryzisoli]|uniref:Uncharacterized protein n=1 Tax=Paenibacillus oryzisoli TaxID=1850517 RepID=A0A198A1M2_9BACL|nr:family 20 glycosylhydrolase [Paenibacillus oryzisoli]OAS14916.1 hypothetical protein A8708_05300 [Paenibacillus oryzisoli]